VQELAMSTSHRPLSRILPLACLVTSTVVLPAQLTPNSWLQAREGYFGGTVLPTPPSLFCTGGMSGQTLEMTAIRVMHSANDAEFWFWTWGLQPGAWRATLAGSNVTGQTRLCTLADVTAMTKLGSDLWLATLTGGLFRIDAALPAQQPIAVCVVSGPPSGLTTDGRELFLATRQPSGTNVWVFDPVSDSVPRPLALVTAPGNGELIGIDLDADGKLRCINAAGYLRAVDRTTGTVTASNTTPMPLWGPFGQTVRGAAHNAWTRTSAVSGTYLGFSPTSPRPYAFLATHDELTGAWSVTSSPGHDNGGALEAVATVPFALFGRECANSLGAGPRIDMSGLPAVGGTFTLQLRAAEPAGFAVPWVGFSDLSWGGVGPLPFDLAPLGAPACRVLVAPDVLQGVTTVAADGRANAAIALPANPAITGFRIFAQWAASTTANALGLSLSNAVAIQIR
jgi:hypothetical protein